MNRDSLLYEKKEKDIVFINEAEVNKYRQENQNVNCVIFEGQVYEVGDYMSQHPGGSDQIEPYLGKCIDEPFEKQGHSLQARGTFKSLKKIGYLKNFDKQESTTSSESITNASSTFEGLDGYNLKSKYQWDYNKPLIYQIWKADISFEQYKEWVNEPKHLVNPPRQLILFENPILENCLTKTPWFMIPTAWLPLVIQQLYYNQLELLPTILLFIFGVLSWTLVEYILHRFLFHAEEHWFPRYKILYLIHFSVHGIHHCFPMDKYRLVFPPLLGYIFYYFGFLKVYQTVWPVELQCAIIAGGLFGYLVYDTTHYFLHHSSPKQGYLKKQKVYHMYHHYRNNNAGYGVSSKFWDIIFRTELKF